MSDMSDDDREDFLRRWSRLKEAARRAETAPAPAGGDSEPPVLPPIEKLTLESDYRGFFHPKVEEALRRAALKKLFSDPHFNVMDGLDVYIDDYSKSDPLPAAMLEELEHAQKILRWAREAQQPAPVPQSACPATAVASDVAAAPAEPAAQDSGSDPHNSVPPASTA